MRWQSEWRALSQRLDALRDLAKAFTDGGALGEYYGASNETLVPALKDLWDELKAFGARFEGGMPPKAVAILKRHLLANTKLFQRDGNGPIGLQGAIFMLGILMAARAHVDYALADTEFVARRLVDRAVPHLQRSFVADRYVNAKWRRTFREGETACERLGAAHLLSHGLWAFKADAKGGRTDLIIGGPVQIEQATRSAEAMVLTEWKLVRDGDDPAAKLKEAITQAQIYCEEVLAGFEIESRRYAVLVADQTLAGLPEATEREGKTYQTVPLALSPANPSTRSRAASKPGP